MAREMLPLEKIESINRNFIGLCFTFAEQYVIIRLPDRVAPEKQNRLTACRLIFYHKAVIRKAANMGGFVDLTGQKFGRLTVLQKDESGKSRRSKWICKCECGNYKVANISSLRSGKTKSCGCLRKEMISRYNTEEKTTHGQTHSRLYSIWRGIKKRCTCKNHTAFKNYGGRGIQVCEEWRDFAKFYDWSVKNGYRNDLTIDRIDVNGDYCPENCRWITLSEQSRNRRSNHNITYNGETHTISEWSEITKIGKSTIQERLRNGWSEEDSVTIPVRRCRKRVM